MCSWFVLQTFVIHTVLDTNMKIRMAIPVVICNFATIPEVDAISRCTDASAWNTLPIWSKPYPSSYIHFPSLFWNANWVGNISNSHQNGFFFSSSCIGWEASFLLATCSCGPVCSEATTVCESAAVVIPFRTRAISSNRIPQSDVMISRTIHRRESCERDSLVVSVTAPPPTSF